MKTAFLPMAPWFGHRMAGALPTRRRAGLGQAGCIEPSPTGAGGCRDVIPCPKGPATGNNPDGAAAPGQGRRYTLVDYITGALIKDDVGDEIWNQYSVTSLPDAWVCEDPRCKPYCGTSTETTTTETSTPAPTEQESTPVQEPVQAPQQGPIPISIDIQAFTPGYQSGIPTAPYQPIQKSAQPPQAPAAAPKEPPKPLPPAQKSASLDTGSAVGIGVVALTAIAAAFFGGK